MATVDWSCTFYAQSVFVYHTIIMVCTMQVLKSK